MMQIVILLCQCCQQWYSKNLITHWQKHHGWRLDDTHLQNGEKNEDSHDYVKPTVGKLRMEEKFVSNFGL